MSVSARVCVRSLPPDAIVNAPRPPIVVQDVFDTGDGKNRGRSF